MIGYKSLSPDLSDAEMKYLYDNGFKVLTMSNLKYNQNTNSLYLGMFLELLLKRRLVSKNPI